MRLRIRSDNSNGTRNGCPPPDGGHLTRRRHSRGDKASKTPVSKEFWIRLRAFHPTTTIAATCSPRVTSWPATLARIVSAELAVAPPTAKRSFDRNVVQLVHNPPPAIGGRHMTMGRKETVVNRPTNRSDILVQTALYRDVHNIMRN